MASESINASLQDAQIAHAVGIMRYRSGVAKKMIAVLEASESDLKTQLNDRLEAISERGYDLGPATTKRLQTLLAAVSTTLKQTYSSMGDDLKEELYSAINYEAKFQVDLMTSEIGLKDLALSLPPPSALRSIVTKRPIAGRLFDDLIADASSGAVMRANSAIRLGIVQGETRPQIVARVLGNDGLGLSKRGVVALTQTAVTNVMAQAREDVFSANADIIAGVRWVSTLDSRTSPTCQALDGRVFAVGKGLRPPAHINCRSTTVPMLNGQSEILGERASAVGPVPAKQTYSDWLRNQPEHVQDEVLGVERAKLFRDSKLPLSKFVDDTGRYYTLDELKDIPGIGKPGPSMEEVAALRAKHAAELAAAQRAAALKEANRAAAKEMQAATHPVLLKKIGAIKKDQPNLSPTKVLAQAKAALKAAQEKAAQTSALNGMKQKLLAGDVPTAHQAKVLAGLSEAEAAQFSQEVDQAKAHIAAYKSAKLAGEAVTTEQSAAFELLSKKAQQAAEKEIEQQIAAIEAQKAADAAAKLAADAAAASSAAAHEVPMLDLNGWTVSRPKTEGSVPGAFYRDPSGTEWLVKRPRSEDVARNEALTAQLYKVAGSAVPDVRLIKLEDGSVGVASRVVPIVKQTAAELASLPGVQTDFVVDAWLSNWDAVGLSFDNIVAVDGRAMRIDVGGGLRYRAQGGLKGAAFGSKVDEIDSLRSGMNPQAQRVFSKITQADLEAGAAKVLSVSDAEIDRLVDQLGPLDSSTATELKATLKARREDVARRFPNVSRGKAVAVDGARITIQEQRLIEAARVNGYSIRTDSGELEDQRVILTVLQRKDGSAITRANLKLRPEAARRLQATMKVGTAPTVDLRDLEQSLTETLRGVGGLVRDSGVIRDKDVARFAKVVGELQRLRMQLAELVTSGAVDAAHANAVLAHYAPWVDRLSFLQDFANIGKPAVDLWSPPAKSLFKAGEIRVEVRAPAVAAGDFPWRAVTESYTYEGAAVVRGQATLTGETYALPGDQSEWFSAELAGVRVRYIPTGGRWSYSSEGSMQIEVDGVGVDASARVFDALEQMKVNAKRVDEAHAEELYLDKVAMQQIVAQGPGAVSEWHRKFDGIADVAERNAAKLKDINERAGFDVTKAPEYVSTRQGVHQAFENGHITWYRPDIEPKAFKRFEKGYSLYHNPTGLSMSASRGMGERLARIIDGGGQLASIMDRARRGLPPPTTSASADMGTGGGNYVYTRIKSRSKMFDEAGFYWRANSIKRLDARSFGGDVFGNAKPDSFGYRGTTIEKWRDFARSRSNETVFKDGLSLFDDLQVIVMPTQAEWRDAIEFMKAHGYSAWPDGRPLDQVITYTGRSVEVPD